MDQAIVALEKKVNKLEQKLQQLNNVTEQVVGILNNYFETQILEAKQRDKATTYIQ